MSPEVRQEVSGEESRQDGQPEIFTGASAFDPTQPWRLSQGVALRDESFGALAYDFSTRRLSFLKTRLLVEVVRGLESSPDVTFAMTAAGVPEGDRPKYLGALDGLAHSGMITPR